MGVIFISTHIHLVPTPTIPLTAPTRLVLNSKPIKHTIALLVHLLLSKTIVDVHNIFLRLKISLLILTFLLLIPTHLVYSFSHPQLTHSHGPRVYSFPRSNINALMRHHTTTSVYYHVNTLNCLNIMNTMTIMNNLNIYNSLNSMNIAKFHRIQSNLTIFEL